MTPPVPGRLPNGHERPSGPRVPSSTPALALELFEAWAALPGVSVLEERLVDLRSHLLFQQTRPRTASSTLPGCVCRADGGTGGQERQRCLRALLGS